VLGRHLRVTSLGVSRLAAQHIGASRVRTVQGIVSWLLAVQAQDPLAARWALGARLPGVTERDVIAALDDGRILRTHVMRGTWQYVVPEDLQWLLSLFGPKVRASAARRHQQLGLDAKTLARSEALLEKALQQKPALSREGAREVLEAAKPGKVDVKALEADLLSMDFVEACAFGSFEKSYSCPAETLENLSFTRTTAEGDLSFQLQGTVAEPKVTHTNFQSPPSTKTQVFVSKGEPYLQVTAFGAKEYHRVLSYEAGVLVVKLTKDGKLRSKSPKWFAQVRVAIPRLFESTGR